MRVFMMTVGLLCAVPARAEVVKLSQAVEVAMRQSPELADAKIDIDAARAELVREQGIHDTRVGATLRGDVSKFAITNPLEAGKVRSIGGTVYVSRLLSTGGTVELGLGGSFTRTTLGGATTDVYAQSVDVTVRQPLLKGAGGAATDGSIRAATHLRDAVVLERDARARELVVAITIAYWQVALAKTQLDVQRGSVAQAEKQLELTNGAIRADKVAKSELIPVEEAIAIRKANALAAEQALLERSLTLRVLCGLEISPDALGIDPEALPKLDKVEVDVAAVLRTALANSPRLARIAAEGKAATAELARARGLDRSTLDLEITGGPLARGTTFSGSLDNVGSNTGYTASASLRFEHAIGMRSETGAVLAARADVTKVAVAERLARAEIAAAVTRSLQRSRAAFAMVELSERAATLAEQAIDAEQRRFELGKTTNFEVLRRHDELEQARLRKIAATVDYLTARAELEGLGGTILAKHGIVLQ